MNGQVRKAAVISGVVLTALGVLLLFWTQNVLIVLQRWWPAGITVVGAWFLYRAWFRKARPSVLFMGLLLFLLGVFMSAINALSADPVLALKDLWPAVMGIVGISLIPYGARYRRTIRVTLVIPGIILIVLSGVFLLFSLSIVKQSFAEFVISWWPLVLVFMGIILIGSGWVGRKE
jgi:hypothetical protein